MKGKYGNTKPYGNTVKPHKMTIYVIMMRENQEGGIWRTINASNDEEEAINRIIECEEYDRYNNKENKYVYRYEKTELF